MIFVKYCEADCISLYQVLIKFRDLIINKFNIDILKYSTVPSLAFGIYRMHYLNDDTIPLTTGLLISSNNHLLGVELICIDLMD